MLGIIVLLCVGSLSFVVVGYLLFKIFMHQKQKKIIPIDTIISSNASTRGKRSMKVISYIRE